jgi:hypothetical protein
MRNWERWDYVLSPLLSQNPKLLRRENSLPFFLRFLDRAGCRCRHGDNSTAESAVGLTNGNGGGERVGWSEGEFRVRTKKMNWGNGLGVERRKWCCGSKDIEARHLHLVLLCVCVWHTHATKISQLFIYFNQFSLFIFIFLKKNNNNNLLTKNLGWKLLEKKIRMKGLYVNAERRCLKFNNTYKVFIFRLNFLWLLAAKCACSVSVYMIDILYCINVNNYLTTFSIVLM